MRYITLTEEIINGIKAKMFAAIDKQLNGTRIGGKTTVDIKYTPEEVELENPIILNFTGIAWAKMQTLVQCHKDEIAWHGTVRTTEDRKGFQVDDILVYPQTVSAATVVTDEAKYQAWRDKQSNAVYNAIRFQAHSHVNMAVSPSPTDRDLYDKFLANLREDSFYIFMIINKRNEWHLEIYDLLNNAIYDNNDITVLIEGIDMDDWYATSIDDNIATFKPAGNITATGAAAGKQPAYPNYNDGYGYGGYPTWQDYYDDLYGKANKGSKKGSKK